MKKGAKQERNRITAWLRDPLAERPLAAIRSMDIAAWRSERVAAGKAPTTIKNALTIVSQVFQVAGTEWGMEGLQNPVRGVRIRISVQRILPWRNVIFDQDAIKVEQDMDDDGTIGRPKSKKRLPHHLHEWPRHGHPAGVEKEVPR